MNDELKEIQDKLLSADTSDAVSKVKKNGTELSYISWADAWRAVLKICPDANYEVVMFDGKPYMSGREGYMVQTTVTIAGVCRSMWLPVMDTHNKAMREEPYECSTRNSSFTVDAVSATDINKAIMRCLVKNIAMFGYGLNIYQGDDVPDVDEIDYVRPTVHCEDCGEVICDVKRKDGSLLRAESIIENSRALYKKALCAKCVTKLQKAAKEETSNNAKPE